MDNSAAKENNRNFYAIFLLLMSYFNCSATISGNIENIVRYLPGSKESLIALMAAFQLAVGLVSLLIFGYYSDTIAEKYSRKKVFLLANLIICISFFLVSISISFTMFYICLLIASFGTGVHLPIGFAIVGDSYPPNKRGEKFGSLSSGMLIGAGGGLIFGTLIGSLGFWGWRIAYAFAAFLMLFALGLYQLYGLDIEQGKSDPELQDYEGEIRYDYKITFARLSQIMKKKTVLGVLLTVTFTSMAFSTIALWEIYFISKKIVSDDALLIALFLVIITGLGSLPGSILGGKIGDNLSKSGKKRGRILISLVCSILATFLFMIYYIFLPFNVELLFFSCVIFFIFGFFGYFCITISTGNIYAMYSECCVPENRGVVNAINGIAGGFGAVIGHLLISSFIAVNLSFMTLAFFFLLLIAMGGSFLWFIPYKYYPKEAEELRKIMVERRRELEKKLN